MCVTRQGLELSEAILHTRNSGMCCYDDAPLSIPNRHAHTGVHVCAWATTNPCAPAIPPPVHSPAHTHYSNGYTESSRVVRLFWEVVEGFSPAQRSQLLRFVTSCGRAPLGGFQHLNPPFTIHRVDCGPRNPLAGLVGRDVDLLPSARCGHEGRQSRQVWLRGPRCKPHGTAHSWPGAPGRVGDRFHPQQLQALQRAPV